MRLENSFVVPASPDQAWELLMDVPRVVPCMPGAELVETVSDTEWKATLASKLGPISLLFLTDVKREEVDEENRVVTLSARAQDKRGRGQADVAIRSALVVDEGETRVEIQTDLSLSGSIARFGRASVVQDMASLMVAEFATALRAELEPPAADAVGGTDAGGGAPAVTAPVGAATSRASAPAVPVSGLRLLFATLRRTVGRWFRRPTART